MSLLSLACLLVASAPVQSQEEALRERWLSFRRKEPPQAFAAMPSVKGPYAPGQVHSEMKEEALRFLNFCRFIAGLPDDVKVDPKLEKSVQEAAMVLGASEEVSHQPRKPAGIASDLYERASETLGQSNLSYRLPVESLRGALHGQMLDDDLNNLATAGHRRWLLNPYMAVTGMGQAYSADGQSAYSVVFAFDQSREEAFEKPYVAWPSAGAFPVEFVSARMPWTISINDEVLRPPGSGEITLKISGQGKSWELRPTDGATASRAAAFARIDRKAYGLPICIVFRTEASVKWAPGDVVDITVEGLKNQRLEPTKIQFQVRFFALEPR